jgi:beta-phosphoglucomutase
MVPIKRFNAMYVLKSLLKCGMYGQKKAADLSNGITVGCAGTRYVRMIKGIIYDLDGTLIDTLHLHERAWQAAGAVVGVRLSRDVLLRQRGVANEEAVYFLFPKKTKEEKEMLVRKKHEYVAKHVGGVEEADYADEVVSELQEKKYRVWICTGAPKDFVMLTASQIPVVDRLKNNTVWREMYTQGKPSAEPLLAVLSRMYLSPHEVLFVGDSVADYMASKDAGILFVYFLPVYSEPDGAIPRNVFRIENHKEIFQYLRTE